nr:MAG TPA: hypothetical protein [Caudoviricetes sp.]
MDSEEKALLHTICSRAFSILFYYGENYIG